jgi:enoyl-[acyl-carrier-protein] reductase (NADH)
LPRDFGPRRITVNDVQPGPTDTDMNPADGPDAALMHSVMAINRHGTAADVASLALYLAGPHAGGITGAMLTIDGGFGACTAPHDGTSSFMRRRPRRVLGPGWTVQFCCLITLTRSLGLA